MSSERFTFTDTYVQTTGSVALGFSNHQILPLMGSVSKDQIFQSALFGISVSGSSGNFGVNIMAMCPNGTTIAIAGLSGIGAVKVYIPNYMGIGGTTWSNGGILRPYDIQYQRAVGSSISYTASVWGILYTP